MVTGPQNLVPVLVPTSADLVAPKGREAGPKTPLPSSAHLFAADLKTVGPFAGARGFESHPRR
jgi:hypothetical protein